MTSLDSRGGRGFCVFFRLMLISPGAERRGSRRTLPACGGVGWGGLAGMAMGHSAQAELGGFRSARAGLDFQLI